MERTEASTSAAAMAGVPTTNQVGRVSSSKSSNREDEPVESPAASRPLATLRSIQPFCKGVLLDKALFAGAVLLFYVLTIYGTSQIAANEIFNRQPIRALFATKGCRIVVFEYCWLYMSWTYLWQAFGYGVTWTLRDASLLTRGSTQLEMSALRKSQIYVFNMFELAIGLVLQPLLVFFISREMGKSPWFGSRGAESSCYASLLFHVLQVGLECLEQVAYEKGSLDLRLTFPFLFGVHFAILIRKGHTDFLRTVFKGFWEGMVKYELLGKSALSIQSKGWIDLT